LTHLFIDGKVFIKPEEKIGTHAEATPLQHGYGGDFGLGRNP
jgi:hypothetical protein